MTILFADKQFEDKKQALNEFAFCHYPLALVIDGKSMVFDEFSALEEYLNSLE